MQNDQIKEIYKEVSNEKIQSWERILFDNRLDSHILIKDDSALLSVSLNQSNQKVIKNDCARTRVKERVIQSSFVEYSEKLLTYYCEQNKIKYKQGLNELVGPFVLLKFKCTLTFSTIYNLFVCFVNRHLTNYYLEDEFYSLQASLALLTMLLKYHEPSLHSIFEDALISPEMYATSWILTGLANKLKLDIIYHIWDKIILFDDPLLMYFICLALIIYNKHKVINADVTQVPSILSQLSIDNKAQADDIIDLAFDLNNKTPNSFRLLVDRLAIFNYKSAITKELFLGYDINTMMSLPIFPSENLQMSYPDDINCSSDICSCYSSHFQMITNKQCKYCIDKKKLPYLLIDLRIKNIKGISSICEVSSYEDINSSCGYIQGSIFLNQQSLSDADYEDNIMAQIKEEIQKKFNINQLSNDDNVHIVFITSRTDHFKYAKSKLYQEIITETGIVKHKKSKVLKFSTDYTTQSKRLESLIHIKEYFFLKGLIKRLQRDNWQHVSYVYGGYKEIHDLVLFHELPLVSHGQQCYWCSKAKSKTTLFSSLRTYFKKENKKDTEQIRYSLSTEDIGLLIGDKDNMMFTCLFNEKDGESSHVLLFLSKHSVTMYKQKKVLFDDNTTNGSIFLLLVCLLHSEIKEIRRDSAKGTEVLITFKANTKYKSGYGYRCELMLKIDFFTNEELNKFIVQRNKVLKNNHI